MCRFVRVVLRARGVIVKRGPFQLVVSTRQTWLVRVVVVDSVALALVAVFGRCLPALSSVKLIVVVSA